MKSVVLPLIAISPLQRVMLAGKYGYGHPQIQFRECERQRVQLMPFQGQLANLNNAMQQQYKMALPEVGQWTAEGEYRLAWTGFEQYALECPIRSDGAHHLYPACRIALGQWAAVVDQSHAWAVMQMSGNKASDLLQRHSHLDLDTTQFLVGQCAVTQIAHVTAQLLRLPDSEGNPCYELQVPRSLAVSVWELLSRSTLPFAYQVLQPNAE